MSTCVWFLSGICGLPTEPAERAAICSRLKKLGIVVFEEPRSRTASTVSWIDGTTLVWTPSRSRSLSRSDDPLAGTDGEIRARTETIVNAVGGGAEVNLIALDEAVADECPVLLILAGREPQPVVAGAVHELWAILGGSSLWREELEPRLQEGVMNPQGSPNLDRQGIGRALGFREFARGSTDLAPSGSGGMVLLRNLPTPFSDAPVIRRIAIFETESLNDEVDAVKPQAEFLFDEAGSPGDAEAIRSPVPPLADRNVLESGRSLRPSPVEWIDPQPSATRMAHGDSVSLTS